MEPYPIEEVLQALRAVGATLNEEVVKDTRQKETKAEEDGKDKKSKHPTPSQIEAMTELAETLTIMQRTINDQELEVEAQELRLRQLESQAHHLGNTCGNACQMIWKIDKFKNKFEEAKSGKTKILFSPPFVTHHKGYKLGVSLCPYGDGPAEGDSMSIFLCVLWGTNDSLLPWPFTLPVTYTLLDTSPDEASRNHVSIRFVPNPIEDNLVYLGRPTDCRNPSVGIPKFVQHDQLFRGNYIDNDAIYIKVDVELDDVIKL